MSSFLKMLGKSLVLTIEPHLEQELRRRKGCSEEPAKMTQEPGKAKTKGENHVEPLEPVEPVEPEPLLTRDSGSTRALLLRWAEEKACAAAAALDKERARADAAELAAARASRHAAEAELATARAEARALEAEVALAEVRPLANLRDEDDPTDAQPGSPDTAAVCAASDGISLEEFMDWTEERSPEDLEESAALLGICTSGSLPRSPASQVGLAAGRESDGGASGVASRNGPASPKEPDGSALHTEIRGSMSLMELEVLSLRAAVRRLEEELAQHRADDVAKRSEYLLSKVEASLEVTVERRARALVEEHAAHLTARIHAQIGALEAVIDQNLPQLVEERLRPIVEAKLVSIIEADIAPQVEAQVVSLVKEGFPEVVKERFGKFLERIPGAINPVLEQRIDELATCVDERLARMDERIGSGNKLDRLRQRFAKHQVGGRSSSPSQGPDVEPDDDEHEDGSFGSTLCLADEDATDEGQAEAEVVEEPDEVDEATEAEVDDERDEQSDDEHNDIDDDADYSGDTDDPNDCGDAEEVDDDDTDDTDDSCDWR